MAMEHNELERRLRRIQSAVREISGDLQALENKARSEGDQHTYQVVRRIRTRLSPFQ